MPNFFRNLCQAGCLCSLVVFGAQSPTNNSYGVEQIEQGLQPRERERIAELIEQLGHAQFRERELAVAELRSFGPRAFYLLSSQKDAVDAEVRSRVRQLLSESAPSILRMGVRTSEVPYIADYHGLSHDQRRLRIRDLGTSLMPSFGCTVLLRIATTEPDERTSKVAAAAMLWQPVPTDLTTRTSLRDQLEGIQGERVSLRWISEYAKSLEDPEASITTFDRFVADERAILETAAFDSDEVDIMAPLERFTIDLRVRAALKQEATDRALALFDKGQSESVLRVELIRWLYQARFHHLLATLGEKHAEWFVKNRFCQYLLAASAQDVSDVSQATQLSDQAFENAASDVDRREVADQLRVEGLNEWAEREYRAVCEQDGKLVDSEEASNAIDALHNMLHQQQRYKECYELLEHSLRHFETKHPANRLERAMGQDPQIAQLRIAYQKGLEAQRNGNDQEAIKYFREALPYATSNTDVICDAWQIEDPEFHTSLDQLKRVIIDQHQQMIAQRERSLSPQTKAVYEQQIAEFCNELAWIMINTGEDVETALRYARRSVELRPGLGHSLDTLAVCHLKHGDVELALQYERQALRLLPYREDIQRTLKLIESASTKP